MAHMHLQTPLPDQSHVSHVSTTVTATTGAESANHHGVAIADAWKTPSSDHATASTVSNHQPHAMANVWKEPTSSTTFNGRLSGNGTYQGGHIGIDHTTSGGTSFGCGLDGYHGPSGTHITGGSCHVTIPLDGSGGGW